MNTPLKIMLCLAICTGFVFSANAQNIRVAGKITAANGTGIAGVHVFDSIAKNGTTSDINGGFSLTIPSKTTKLRFSHIAFNTQYVSLTKNMLSDTIAANTIWLDVVLTQKIMELPLLEISDAKVEIAYKNSKQWILDYEPVGADEFLLLLLERNKKYLQLVSGNHEKISQIVVNKDYSTLLKDCFGTFHLLSKDSACQIFLLDEKLTLLYHNTRYDFDRVMDPIVVNTDNYLYTRDFSGHRQVVLYDKINKETSELTIFIENAEEKRAIMFRDDYFSGVVVDFIKCNGELATPEIIATFRAILHNSKDVDELFRLRWMIAPASICVSPQGLLFYKHVLSKPPYSLLARINDTLYFFDHLNSIHKKTI